VPVRRQATRRPRRYILGVAAAAAAGAALALPSTGAAGVAAIQDDVLTTAPTEDIPARLDLVKQTRAKVTRIDVLWSMVAPTRPAAPLNPADPAYDWGRVDAIMIGLAQARITPIVSVYSTPDWAVAGRNTRYPSAYNPNAPRPAEYGRFMRAFATRYSGTYPNPNAAEGGPPRLPRVRHYEIWNEPNLKNFFRFNTRTTVGRYAALVRAAYPQIKRANRRSIVIAGVAGPRSTTGNGNVGARQWLRGLVNARNLRFDAYSQHIYPSQPPRSRTRAFPSWNSLPEIFATLDRKRKGMKLYITEAGYSTGRTPFRTVRVSPAVQNRNLRQIFALPHVRSPRVPAVVWFNLQDNVNWPAGLLRANGSRKPAYASFVRIARRPIPRALRSELRR
jgi:hypothetical protein